MSESRPTRILLMEDDPGLARLFEKRLTRAGYAVEVARNGEEGLARCEAGKHDVLVVDHLMPLRSGLEVIREMAARGPLPPTIMVTAKGNEQVAVEAMKLGACDYVVKDTDGGYLELLPSVIERARLRKRMESDMRLAAKVFESATEGIIVTDARGAIVSVNQAFTEITGYTAEQVKGMNPRLLQSGRHDATFYESMWTSLRETGQWRGEIWNRRKNGEIYPEWLTISRVENERGEITNYVGVFTDITSRKRTEQRLYHLATHDPLTDLPNRELWRDRMNQAMALTRRTGKQTALMLIDIDHFKQINDSMGHGTGDAVLKAAAERLRSCMRECDTIARLGGDEFAAILGSVVDSEDCAAIVQRILDTLSQPLLLDGRNLSVTASIGVAMFPGDGEDPESLLNSADAAMYRAKKVHNRFEFYTEPPDKVLAGHQWTTSPRTDRLPQTVGKPGARSSVTWKAGHEMKG